MKLLGKIRCLSLNYAQANNFDWVYISNATFQSFDFNFDLTALRQRLIIACQVSPLTMKLVILDRVQSVITIHAS